jgi:hypothetical protein
VVLGGSGSRLEEVKGINNCSRTLAIRLAKISVMLLTLPPHRKKMIIWFGQRKNSIRLRKNPISLRKQNTSKIGNRLKFVTKIKKKNTTTHIYNCNQNHLQ